MEKVPKLSEMNKKDVPGYIWDYYKVPIIAVIIAIGLIIYIANSILTSKNEVLGVVAANCYSLELSDSDSLFYEFMTEEGIDTENNEVALNTSITYTPGSGNIYAFQALMTLINAGRIDVALWDADLFYEIAEYGVFMPVEDYLTEDEIAALSDYIIYAEYEVLDDKGDLVSTEEYAAGIRLTENTWIKKSGLYPGIEPIITVTNGTEHEELAIDFAKYLLQK